MNENDQEKRVRNRDERGAVGGGNKAGGGGGERGRTVARKNRIGVKLKEGGKGDDDK